MKAARSDTYDVIIVGGSWAGLAAAMQLGRARRKVLLLDSGLPRNRFALASHGFLGQDGRSPAEILTTFRDQVLAYPSVRIVPARAENATRLDSGEFQVELAEAPPAKAKRLVLATGVVDELPPLPGLAERWGRSVVHCPYCHGYEVSDRKLGILATGEFSIHQALLLPDWSADVTFFSTGAVQLTDEQKASLQARGVRLEERRVVELLGPAPELTAVRLEGGEVVAVDALFAGSTTRPASPLAEQLGCELYDGHFGPVVRIDQRKQSTVSGVYCAGDAAHEPHTATLAAAAGSVAGMSAHQSLIFG